MVRQPDEAREIQDARLRDRSFVRSVAAGQWRQAARLAALPVTAHDARCCPEWGYRRKLCLEVLAVIDADPAPELPHPRSDLLPRKNLDDLLGV